MSLFKQYEITVDTIEQTKYVMQNVRFSQTDVNSAKLILNITHNGQVIDLSDAQSVRIAFLKGDNTRVFQDCQPQNKLQGKYYVKINTQTIAIAGNVIAQLVIQFADGRSLDTQKFAFVVDDAIMNDKAVESTNEFPALKEAIQAADILKNVDLNVVKDSAQVVQGMQTKVTENETKIGILSEITSFRDYKGFGEIKLPNDFVPKLPFSLYRDRDGFIKHNYDFSKLENYAKVLYCDSSVTGSDTTGDGTTEKPFKTLKKALQHASSLADTEITIRIKGNMMRGQGGTESATAITTLTNKKVSIIPDTANKIIVANAQSSTEPTVPAGLTLTWVADGTAWKTARTNTWNVFDLSNRDIFGVGKPLTYVTSVVLCQSTPNSWYTDGTSVWVNTFNGRQPDGSVLVCINVSNFWVDLVNSTIYFKNIEFYSGFLGSSMQMYGSCFIRGDMTSKIICNQCNFVGGEGRDTGASTALLNGLQFLDTKEVYMFNCIAAYTRRDGFNYHYANTAVGDRRKCIAFEYNCIAYNNGTYGDINGNNNAFTSHEGVSVIRVGGVGYNTKGPVCADVNGCYSIFYDCSMRDSTIDSQYDAAAAYYFDNVLAAVPGKVIFINCEGGSPKYSIYADKDFDIQVRNFTGKNIKSDIALTNLK